MVKNGEAISKLTLPDALFVLSALHAFSILLAEPAVTTTPGDHPDFTSTQEHPYLRDLSQSIPIRGPSLKA